MKSLAGKTVLVLYETNDVLARLAEAHAAHGEELVVLPLDYEIEQQLVDQGIPYCSLADFHTLHDRASWIEPISRMARTWYEVPGLEALQYEGEPLGRAYEWLLMLYLWRAFYYASIARFAFDHYGVPHHMLIPSRAQGVPSTAAALAAFESTLPLRAFTEEAARHGISITVLGSAPVTPKAAKSMAGGIVKSAFALLNLLVSLVTRKRPLRIFMSEYWKNIEPLLPHVRDAELVLIDRRDLAHLWRFLLPLRIRFAHPRRMRSRAMRQEAEATLRPVGEAWKRSEVREAASQVFAYGDLVLWPLVQPALTHLLTATSVELYEDIVASVVALERYGSNRVVVRASISAQLHFYALCVAARKLGVPSIELQHGLEYLAPHSLSARKKASHIAVYGPLVSQQMREAGIPAEMLIEIGSPRFDAYRKEVAARSGATVRSSIICVLPEIGIENFTTYDIATLIRTVDASVAGMDVPVIYKVRPGVARRSFYERCIAEAKGETRLAEYEPLIDLLSEAVLVLATFSTTALEAMLSGVPVILVGTHAVDRSMQEFQFSALEAEGGIGIASTHETLRAAIEDLRTGSDARTRMLKAADDWLMRSYRFDGQASARAASLITLPSGQNI